LLKAIALIEAEIDFSDEDLPQGLHGQAAKEIGSIIGEVSDHLDDNGQGQVLRDGIYITIIGAPNAGKSSLLNILSKRDAAIVSEKAGTTRDVIEVHLELNGYPLILADTAGLREVADDIESEGVRRAEERAQHADLKLAVFDGGVWPEKDFKTLQLIDKNTVVVINKSDLLKESSSEFIPVSAKTGDGLDVLLEVLKKEVAERCHLSAAPALTRTRHRTALEECLANLQRFSTTLETELNAENLRLGARALGRITGRVDVEEVLDIIFREFCIGK
jgi:tRNA modification GTPase